MAKYGEYGSINDCVIAVEFDYTENGAELKALIEITEKHSFRIFPSWMTEKLEK